MLGVTSSSTKTFSNHNERFPGGERAVGAMESKNPLARTIRRREGCNAGRIAAPRAEHLTTLPKSQGRPVVSVNISTP